MARTCVFFLPSLCMLLSLVGTSSAGARKTANIYELRKGDFSVKVTNWGGVILSVVVPDSNGKLGDVVLAYEGLGPYLNDTTYFGALVGRVGNRIAGSRFVLNGKPYRLFRNNGNNSLHGGHRGFSDVFWTVKKKKVDGETPYITLYYHSFDGEQGFPGDLDVYVTYKLSEKYVLSISMEAKPQNKATPVNLIQHTYWNLGGEGSGTILKDKVQIFASQITPVDENLIPTGAFKSVKGTPYDFLKPKEVGSEIGSVKGGYDINYVLDSPADSRGLRKVAVVESGSSGRRMELWADKPGVQFYTAGSMKDVEGKNGHVYPQYGGLCLETQGFPDAVNQPKFPSVIVKPGQVYNHNMVFKFSF